MQQLARKRHNDGLCQNPQFELWMDPSLIQNDLLTVEERCFALSKEDLWAMLDLERVVVLESIVVVVAVVVAAAAAAVVVVVSVIGCCLFHHLDQRLKMRFFDRWRYLV